MPGSPECRKRYLDESTERLDGCLLRWQGIHQIMPLRQGTKKIKHTSYGQKRKICHIAPVSRRGFFFIAEQVRRINQYTKFTKIPIKN